MAGRRSYESSSMAVLLPNNWISSETIDSLLSPGHSHGGFPGSRSVLNFEDAHGQRSEWPFCRPLETLEETGDEDLDEGVHQPEKKRRLTADQVQFLERSFELENKLEPERKAQLARDLGLQPRQIAIWFQNRRARWKTKQLEKDYEALKSSYDTLKADYDNLLDEKEKLQAEVLSLTNKVFLEEKDIGNSEPLECNKFAHQLQNMVSDDMREVKRVDDRVTVCKQEALSSANSTVLDSGSPPYVDEVDRSTLMEPVDSSNAFEPDRSDLTHAGEVDEVKGCGFLRLEDNLNGYRFPVEDQSYWFWP